jgi:hypothetical protein
MAFSFGFYNSKDGDRKYNAEQFSSIFDGIIQDGVYETVGKSLIVIASEESNAVIVQPGRAWFNHTWNLNDSNLTLVSSDGTPFANTKRIDAVVIDIKSDVDNRQNSIIWVTGKETSQDPEQPTLINEDDHHQYPLCYVYRSSDDNGTITQENITNTVGTSECPFVLGAVSGINTDDLILQWQAEWSSYKEKYVENFNTWSDSQKELFEEWFETIKGILNEDVAGNLQNEIDELSSNLSETINNNLTASDDTQFRFGVTEDGKYGYITTGEDGADTVIPFKSGEGTASPEQVLSGYSFTSTDYPDVTDGEMVDNSGWSSTISTVNGSVTIPAGYHDGTGKVSVSGLYRAASGSRTVTSTSFTVSTGLSYVTNFQFSGYASGSSTALAVKSWSRSGGTVTVTLYFVGTGGTGTWVAYGT